MGLDVVGEFLEHRRGGPPAAGTRRDDRREDEAIRRDAGGTSKTVVLTVAGEDRRFIHTFAANTLFDDKGAIAKDATKQFMTSFMAAFETWIGKVRG